MALFLKGYNIKKILCFILILFNLSQFIYAAELNPNISSNNIKDFSLGENKITSEKWSYLDGYSIIENNEIVSYSNLKKGDGNKFQTNQYASDIFNPNHVWYVKSDGSMASDSRTIVWNFTIGKNFAKAEGGINLKGTIGKCRLRILKTLDKKDDKLEGRVETLYDITADNHNFDITIPKEKYDSGNDIMFMVTKTTDAEWWTPMFTNFTVKAMFIPQAAQPSYSLEGPDVPYGSEITLTSPTKGASIYYTLDGSDPSISSKRMLYQSPIKLTGHTDLKSCTVMDGMEQSYVTSTHYIMDYPIREFLGVCDSPVTEVEGFKYIRLDASWPRFEAVQGKIDEKELESFGRIVLNYKKLGYRVLPVIAYSPVWAVDKDGYKFTHTQTGDIYEYGPTTAIKNNDGTESYVGKTHKYNKWGEIVYENQYTANAVTQLDEKSVPAWENFVRVFVSKFSAEPYNIEYFEIWNEPYPGSGFYNGGLEQFMDSIHVPAAKVMREFENVKIVFGGWPCCGMMSELVKLLDYAKAWNLVDVFDIHYDPLAAMDYIYRAAKERGIENPRVWQSELGFTKAAYYPPNIYPRTLRWALEKGMYQVDNDLVKLFWYAAGSPDDPNAYGFEYSVKAGSRFTIVGKGIKAFAELFYGNKLEKFNNFKTTPTLKPEIMEMLSSAEGFLLDDQKAIIAVHLVKQSSYSTLFSDMNGKGASMDLNDPQSKITIDIKGVNGDAEVKRVDFIGNSSPLKYDTLEDGTIRVDVPTVDQNEEAVSYNGIGSHVTTFYLTVEAKGGISQGNWTMTNY